MKSNNLRKIQKSRKVPESVLGKLTVRWLVTLTIAPGTSAPFLPIQWNNYAEWDDYENLISNRRFHGFGWRPLRWT